MKKKLIFTCTAIAFIVSGHMSFAQAPAFVTTTNNGHLVTNSTTTRVGIGDNNPWDLLTVNGNVGFTENGTLSVPGSGFYNNIIGRSLNYGMSLYSNYSFSEGATLNLFSKGNGGSMQFLVPNNGGSLHAYKFEVFSGNGNNGSFDHLMVLKKDGNVGIDDADPWDRLTINGNFGFTVDTTEEEEGDEPPYRFIYGRSKNLGLVTYSNTSFTDGSGIILNTAKKGRNINFMSTAGSSPSIASFTHYTPSGDIYTTVMDVRKDGKVVIGNTPVNTTHNYGLYVQNGIITSRLKVALPTTSEWADFVFANDYKLTPLAEVEEFVNANDHLPGIPSASEVVKEGIDVAAMDAKLLQKIEELTLYVIDQDKKVNALQKEIKALKSGKTNK